MGAVSSIFGEDPAVMSIKAVVDKDNNRVVYVESDQDFVDVVLSFLTLPMGTIIRLMENMSNSQSPSSTVIMRCMDNLYKSVQNLETKYLETEECKTMLLLPRRDLESILLNLKLQIDEMEPTAYYVCERHPDRIGYSERSLCDCYSSVKHTIRDGKYASDCYSSAKHTIRDGKYASIKDGDNKVFVKVGRYIIDNHMNIRAASLDTVTSLLDICGITDWKGLEERTVNIGLDEVLLLLKCTLLSHEPLTDVILRKGKELQAVGMSMIDKTQHSRTQETVYETTNNKVIVTVVVRKSNNQVLYAIAKADFIDLLFSILTFPIGSIVKLCRRNSSILCIDNLYNSVENLYNSVENLSTGGQLRNEAALINPKLKTHFGCERNNLLRVEEAERQYNDPRENPRYNDLRENPSNREKIWSKLMNPKCVVQKETTGGGFVKGSSTFMVTNDLVVTPLCFTSGLFFLKQLNVPLNDVEERTVSIGEQEALNLLKASLVTDTALSSIISPHFLTPKKKEGV